VQLQAVDINNLIGDDTMQIIVDADACEHAKNQPGFVLLVGDLNTDCKVNLVDFGMAASNWLEDNSTK